jgi:hypothetical protein
MGLENGLGPCVSSTMDSNICVLMRRDDSAFVGDLTRDSNWPPHKSVDSSRCYPRYLGITRRSCLEAHMILDMEYESRLT